MEFPIYSYTIYTTSTSAILNYICCLWVFHTVTIRWTCYNYVFDIIVPVPSTMFQIYDITLCDHCHMPLHCPKIKIKSRKIDKKKMKSK